MTPTRITCLDCKYPMTWAQRRVQYGRLLKRGFTEEEAKKLLPRCQTCMTKKLKSIAQHDAECDRKE